MSNSIDKTSVDDEEMAKKVGDPPEDVEEVGDPPEVGQKRPRGPEDCLYYETSDEEEFFPFTQTPEPPKVVVKKSKVKRSSKRVACKKPRNEGRKNGTDTPKGNID